MIALSQAVADGSMTEVAAENILVEVYEFPRDIAKSFIDIPERQNEIIDGFNRQEA